MLSSWLFYDFQVKELVYKKVAHLVHLSLEHFSARPRGAAS